jgi:hypothetical protein
MYGTCPHTTYGMYDRRYKIFVVKLDGTNNLRDLSVSVEDNIQIGLQEKVCLRIGIIHVYIIYELDLTGTRLIQVRIIL